MKRIFSILFTLVLVVSFSLIPAALVGASPGPGLAALWHFDEGSGTTAYDSTTNNNDGALNNFTGTYWVSGKFGSALSFDGSDDYVQIANESNFDFDKNDEFTIEAYVQTDSNGILNIVTKMANSAPNTGYQLIKHDNVGYDPGGKNKLYFFLINTYNTDMIVVYGSTDIADGLWHHVAVTYDGSATAGGVQIYVDGTPETMYTRGSWTTLSGSILNDLPLQISGREGANYAFDGLIDEVRIWDEARSAKQIYQGYAALHVDDDWAQWPGAYRTITAALAVANAGDTIIVHEGTYTEQVNVNISVTIEAAAGEARPLVDGSGSPSTIYIDADNVRVSGLEVLGGIKVNLLPSGRHNVEIDRNEVHGSSWNGIEVLGVQNWATWAPSVATNISIHRNEVYGATMSGISVLGVATGPVSVHRNDVHHNGTSGLYSIRSDNVIFHRNDVYENGATRIPAPSHNEQGGIVIHSGTASIHHNNVHDNWIAGIQVHGFASWVPIWGSVTTSATIHHNVVKDNKPDPVPHPGGNWPWLVNTSYGIALGIAPWSGTWPSGNVVHNNNISNHTWDRYDKTGGTANTWFRNVYTTSNF